MFQNSNFDYDNGRAQPTGPSFGLSALIVGAALGTGIAILLNSKPGQELRGTVTNWLNDRTAHLAASIAEGRERVVSEVEKNRI